MAFIQSTLPSTTIFQNVQADWLETVSTEPDFIKNKPDFTSEDESVIINITPEGIDFSVGMGPGGGIQTITPGPFIDIDSGDPFNLIISGQVQNTNLLVNRFSNTNIISNDNGTGFTLNLADETEAGLLSSFEKALIGTSLQPGDIDLSPYQLLSQKGVASGYGSLDINGKQPLSEVNDALLGNVNYRGLWNALTNTPNLNVVESKGHYYIVSTASIQFGIDFQIGDWIISNGTSWDKVDNTDAVSSVAGLVGTISAGNLRTALSINNIDNTSDANKPVSTAQATAIGLKQNQLNGTGLVRMTGTTVTYDSSVYITGNQSISFTPNIAGDITGSATGATSLTPTLIIGASKVTNTHLAGGIAATKIGAGNVDNTEFGYLDGVTSSIQTQINDKLTIPTGSATLDYLTGTGTTAALGTATLNVSLNAITPANLVIGNGITIRTAFARAQGQINALIGTLGTSVQSGTGAATSFVIPHGLGSLPTFVNVQAGSIAASNIAYRTYDATNITVFYSVAPPAATNNLTFNWMVR